MKHAKQSPALDKALVALQHAVERQSASGIAFLPSIGELSRSAGVCHVTIRRALRILETEGAVQIVARRGIQITGPVAAAVRRTTPEEERLPPRWSQVAEAVIQEILNGKHRRGEALPSCKELVWTHAACHAVVKRALASLVRRNQIEPSGRGFRVLQTRAAGARSTVVLAAFTDDPSVLSGLTYQSAELWRSIERECDRRNVTLELRSLGACLRTKGPLTSRPKPVLGCIVWSVAPRPQTVVDVARTAVEAGLPVAVIDEGGVSESMWAGPWSAGVTFFRLTTSEEPGHRMGLHLTRLGHRRLAYVTPEVDDIVSQRRLQGLQRALADGGLRPDVDVFAPQRRLTSEEAISGSASFRQWQEGITAQASEFCSAVGAVRDGTIPYRFAWEYGRNRLTAVELQPAFKAVAGQRDITAWVCYNDVTGLAALAFCQRHRIAVPQRLSIAGFDDTIEAFGRGLTSYNFNMPATVSAVFEHLLTARLAGRPGTGPRRFETPGMVMERASTGQAQ
jgi:DNA-binding LacI/PurR family transcriptional regulator/DNA-binding transcriptional regulator YhcF (GntR family)